VLTELDRGAPSLGEAGVAALAGAGNALGLLAFYRAASVGPLSIAAPLGSLGALVPVLVGVAQGEGVGGLKLPAIALAMTGVALAARPGTPRADTAGATRDDRRAAAGWALLSSVGFGIFLAGMAPAADAGIFWAVLVSRVSLLAIFVAVAWWVGAALRVSGRDLPRVAVPGLLLFGGTLLYTAATREGDLSVVAVLGSLFPVVTVGLAFALLGERLTRVQGAGAAAAMVGSVLLAAAG
jgi:drug/metabolite transporter (DMT)-like permease